MGQLWQFCLYLEQSVWLTLILIFSFEFAFCKNGPHLCSESVRIFTLDIDILYHFMILIKERNRRSNVFGCWKHLLFQKTSLTLVTPNLMVESVLLARHFFYKILLPFFQTLLYIWQVIPDYIPCLFGSIWFRNCIQLVPTISSLLIMLSQATMIHLYSLELSDRPHSHMDIRWVKSSKTVDLIQCCQLFWIISNKKVKVGNTDQRNQVQEHEEET